MPVVVQDGFPGQGAVTNLAGVDPDEHLGICLRSPAVYQGGVYRGVVTATFGSFGAGTNLFELLPVAGLPRRLALVNSVRAAVQVATTITTGVLFDLGLYIGRNTGNPAYIGTTGLISPPVPPQLQLRSSMACSTTAVGAGISGSLGTDDTNPIGRVQGFSGTAVGTQFFSPSVATLYSRDNNDNYPIVLKSGIGGDALGIETVFATPATGTWTISVAVEWSEVLAY